MAGHKFKARNNFYLFLFFTKFQMKIKNVDKNYTQVQK